MATAKGQLGTDKSGTGTEEEKGHFMRAPTPEGYIDGPVMALLSKPHALLALMVPFDMCLRAADADYISMTDGSSRSDSSNSSSNSSGSFNGDAYGSGNSSTGVGVLDDSTVRGGVGRHGDDGGDGESDDAPIGETPLANAVKGFSSDCSPIANTHAVRCWRAPAHGTREAASLPPSPTPHITPHHLPAGLPSQTPMTH